MSVLDSIPLEITAYACVICNHWHKKGSKKFIEHWDRHFDKNNKYIGNKSVRENKICFNPCFNGTLFETNFFNCLLGLID